MVRSVAYSVERFCITTVAVDTKLVRQLFLLILYNRLFFFRFSLRENYGKQERYSLHSVFLGFLYFKITINDLKRAISLGK